MDKLINRIPGSRLLISSLPGSALRTHVESLGKPRDVNKRPQSLAWLLFISKDTHVVFSISRQASLGKLDIKRLSASILNISESLAMSTALSKPCLVNLISKDTHVVFSISRHASLCQQTFSKPCLVNLIS